ncbi:putative ABC transport system permease protein [Marinimicrobium koreense]|uniref:Putative ABC transport system permease protein n=1 Tax=Marinimicrobium koreense TaxID=306545 RepID=A0A3N1NLQ5_9GAMM|nr:ABC transporter permease [Marinimicrobium koreense]ROQ20724.1 putative ABC transport system permease protein [Marinimicrobium koreense]
MRALNTKLLRNLWTLKGQGLAIAVVIATGVAMFVMSFTALDALRLSQQSVYQSQRFSEVFANLKRAPESLADRLRAVPGVATLETRVQAPVKLQVPGFDQPVTGLAQSIPDGRQPQLNQLHLRTGQLPEAGRNDQVLLSEAFAEAHELQPGDRLSVVINGRYQTLWISGIALSPEYIYQIRPGDLFPDFSRYAILWMNRDALESAFDMEGAFNNVTLTLYAGANPQTTIDHLDGLLEPWGGLGAYGRDDQLSHRFIEQELEQIAAMAVFLPLIFIGVSAFLLNVVAARLIRTQREQIAVLKAFGYDSLTVAGHYLMLVLVIVLIGSILGVLLGTWLASALAGLYQDFFRFPWLEFRLRASVALTAIVIAGGATALGTLTAVYRAFRLPPAEAMRPEPPTHFRRTLIERLGIRGLSQPTRIILRNLERQPIKAGLSILGISLAVGMMMLTGFQKGSIDYMMDVQFRLAQQQDMTVSFIEPTQRGALHELAALPGVRYVEGFRSASAILHYGHRSYRGGVQGFSEPRHLVQVLDDQLQPIAIPDEGVLLTDHLATMLGIGVGDTLQVKVQEGRQPELAIPVAGLVTEFIGVGAYLRQDTLARLLGEGDTVSGAFLAVDPELVEEVNRRLEAMPRVAGVNQRDTTIRAFDDMMADSMLVFTFFSVFMAGSIAFAVVYNNARIAFAERSRELATLRVLGFTRAEIAFILLGELLLLTVLAMPLGFLLGAGLCQLLTLGMQTDLYRVPLVLTADTYASAALVVLVATLLSALMMGRALVKLDMVSALKSAE